MSQQHNRQHGRDQRRGRHPLRLVPLGGLGEIGKNMMAVEYGEDIVIIDAGLMFPDEEMLGVDLVIPDTTYLNDKLDRIRGIFITHGHEDHIGALPYVLPRLNFPPVYSLQLTLGLIGVKLREHRLLDLATLTLVDPAASVQAGAIHRQFRPRQSQHPRRDGDCGAHTSGHPRPYRRLQVRLYACRSAARRYQQVWRG